MRLSQFLVVRDTPGNPDISITKLFSASFPYTIRFLAVGECRFDQAKQATQHTVHPGLVAANANGPAFNYSATGIPVAPGVELQPFRLAVAGIFQGPGQFRVTLNVDNQVVADLPLELIVTPSDN